MGRRNSGGALDDLFELTALCPWWVGIGLAVVSYVLLHWYATIPIEPVSQPAQTGGVSSVIYKGLATGLQYILPMIFVSAAIVSAIKRATRKKLIAGAWDGKSAGVLQDMTWQEFEMLVAEAFRLEGYAVAERAQGGADGGVDVVLRKGSEKYLVQCKQWRAMKVSVVTLRELYGVMAAEGAAGGFVVTSGHFTEDALEFARGRNLRLIDGDKLFAMIKRAQASSRPSVRKEPITRDEPTLAASDPACPKCGNAMARRTARRGSNAGKDFWGCVAFPKCTGIRSIG